jgi:hypothetical protein
MDEHRGFRGIWIPKEIYLDERLDANEKILFSDIYSLSDEKKGCFASNEYFAKFLKVSDRQVQRYISNLKKYNLILQTNFDGRQRSLICNFRYDMGVVSAMTKMANPLLLDINKERKGKKVSSLKKTSENSKYLLLSEYLLKKIKDSGTDAVFKESDLGKWNNQFRLMIEQDKRTEEQIRSKVDAVFEDQFWSKQIRSAGTLREKWKLGRLDGLGDSKKSEAADDNEETAPEAPKTPFQRFKGNTTLTDSEVVLNYLYRQWEAIYGDKGWQDYNFPDADSKNEALYREIWEVYRDIKDKKQAFEEILKRFNIKKDEMGSSVENEEW